MADNLTEYLLGCDPFEPNIFKDPDHMEQQLPKPLVSDEEIELCADQYHAGQGRLSDDNEGGVYSYRADGVSIGLRHARNLYEPELQSLRSQVEAMRVAGDALVAYLHEASDMAVIGPKPSLEWHKGKLRVINAWTASLNPTPTTEPK